MRHLVLATVVALVVHVSPLAHGATWRAGVARAVITPDRPMWMSGYAGRNKPGVQKLHDLWAKALVIEDAAGQRAAIVTLDLVGIDRATSLDIRQAIEKQHKLSKAQVALCTSHTHTGPVVGDNLMSMYFLSPEHQRLIRQYTKRVTKTVVRLVGDAIKDLELCDLSQGSDEATFGVNRRNNRESDVPKLREADQLRGPVDHTVPVLRVATKAGKVKAIVFGYACHATTLSFYQWTGDYPGFAQLELEKRHPGASAMFWAGCGADINPLPRRKVELAEGYGRQLADAVDRALKKELANIRPDLDTRYREVDLRYDKLPTVDDLKRAAASTNRYERSRATRLLADIKRDGELTKTYPCPVQTWRLGDDLSWVFLGGEVVVDFAIRLKRELGAESTWVVGYANDVMAYIPSERVLREGGYEGAGAMVYYGLPSKWAVGVESAVVQAVHEQVKSLKADE